MKKMMFLTMFSIVFMGIYESKSQDKKQQYVKWTTVPKPESVEQLVEWLKKAMVHDNTIIGAEVRSYPESYISVWGQSLYDEILVAPVTDFSDARSAGGEINHGVYEDGTPAAMQQPLPAGMKVLAYKGVPVAKWGDNGCINALRPGTVAKKPKTVTKDPVETDNTASNGRPWVIMTQGTQPSNTTTVVQAPPVNVTIAMPQTAVSQCQCPQTVYQQPQVQQQPTTYVRTVAYAEQPVYQQPPVQQQEYPSEVVVYNKPNVLDYINTAANVANTVFNGVNTFRGIRFEGNNTGRVRNYNNGGPGFNWNNNGGGNYNSGGPVQGGFNSVRGGGRSNYSSGGYNTGSGTSGSASGGGFGW